MTLKKTYPWNVLIFPAASEIGLEIARALRGLKEVVVHGANQSGASVASYHYRRLHELPRIDAADCLPRLQQLIAAEKIDAIFPAYDDVLLWLAQRAPQLAAAVMAPAADVCDVCRSKSATYETLGGFVPVPRVWERNAADMEFPVFVKPDRGQGSQRARRIDNRADLDRALVAEPDLLVMENLPGEEFTVDCFSRPDGGILFAGARLRQQTKNGIATITRREPWLLARAWADAIAKRLGLHGTWFFQVKMDAAGQPRLLEVAPRIAGSMALSRAMGPNFPLLSLYQAAGYDVTIEAMDIEVSMGRCLDARFRIDTPMDALYVDLDDTLIVRGEVNTQLVALIFQCRNRGVPVYLLTRHKADLDATLAKFRLAHFFDHIVHVRDDEVLKADFIRETNAVLIDDSFRERSAVTRKLGIRCYDPAGALCLLDDRV